MVHKLGKRSSVSLAVLWAIRVGHLVPLHRSHQQLTHLKILAKIKHKVRNGNFFRRGVAECTIWTNNTPEGSIDEQFKI